MGANLSATIRAAATAAVAALIVAGCADPYPDAKDASREAAATLAAVQMPAGFTASEPERDDCCFIDDSLAYQWRVGASSTDESAATELWTWVRDNDLGDSTTCAMRSPVELERCLVGVERELNSDDGWTAVLAHDDDEYTVVVSASVRGDA